MIRADAEQHAGNISRTLSAIGYPTPDVQRYGRLEIVEESGDFRVRYQNLEEGFIWDLTGANIESAATSIRRWDCPNYRALRDGFSALIAGALKYEWVDPYLDIVEVLEPLHGIFSIDSVGRRNEYRLLWRAAGNESQAIDLSSLDAIESARAIFGDQGADAAERWSRPL